MKSKRISAVVIAVSLVVSGSMARAAQDKYTVKVPNGLAFSEFRGNEGWQTVAISHNEKMMAVIVAIPGNSKPFPDGSKMAKVHWILVKDGKGVADPDAGSRATPS